MYRLLLKILVSVILLVLIFLNVESKDIFNKLSAISLWAVIGALVCLIIQSFLVSGRWRIILAKCCRDVPYLEVIKMHYMSLGISIFLPNLIAEPVLKPILTRKYNINLTSSLLSVVLDKLFVVSGLIVMTLFVIPIVFILYHPRYELMLVYTFMLICIFTVYILFTIIRNYNLWPKFKKYIWKYEIFSNITNLLILDGSLIIRCISITIISQVVSTTAFYILCSAMDAPISFQECLLLITPAQLITTLPIAFNGWGIREISIIYMLGIVNLPPDTALVLSIQYGLIGILLWSIGLLSWIFIRPELSFKTEIPQNAIK